MNDPFANGPLVFRPRPEFRRAQGFMAAFFVFFLLVGLSFPIMGGERGRAFFAFMALICTVCFGGFLAMVLMTLRDTRGAVYLTGEGVQTGRRQLAWSEIASVEERSRPDPMLVLKPKEGRAVSLYIRAYEDGAEMARIAQSRVVLPVVSVDGERTYRPQGRGLSAFAYGILLAMALGFGIVLLGTPVPNARLHPAFLQVGVMVPLVLWLAARSLTTYVRLGSTELTSGWLLGHRTLPLGMIEAVNATDAGLVVRSGSRKMIIRKGLEDYDELRGRLLHLASTGLSRQAEAPTPIPWGERRVFEPMPNAWAGPGVLFIFGTAFIAFIVVGLGWFGFAMMVVPIAFDVAAFWALLESRTRIVIDDEAIKREAIFGSRHLAWREIDRAWREGPTLEGYSIRTGKVGIDVSNDFLADLPTLRATLNERLADARENAYRSAEGETFGPNLGSLFMLVGFLGLAGVGMVAAGLATFARRFTTIPPGQEAAAYLTGFLWLACGAGLIFGAASVAIRRYTPTPDGLTVRTLRGRRFLRWVDVRRVEGEVQDTGKREHRRATLTLEHPEGSVKIDGMTTREFDRLRGYIVSRVDPTVVREAAGVGTELKT